MFHEESNPVEETPVLEIVPEATPEPVITPEPVAGLENLDFGLDNNNIF